jgi:hypothetical protein
VSGSSAETTRLPAAEQVLGAFVAGNCHGDAWYRLENVDNPLPSCPDRWRCDAERWNDLGEVQLHCGKDLSEPVRYDDLVECVSLRKPRAGSLPAAIALAALGGPQIVFDTVDVEPFLVLPGHRAEDLAATWSGRRQRLPGRGVRASTHSRAISGNRPASGTRNAAQSADRGKSGCPAQPQRPSRRPRYRARVNSRPQALTRTLDNTQHQRALDLIRRLKDPALPDVAGSELLDELKKLTLYPRVGDLLFWRTPELTADEVIDEALRYQPFV